VIKVSEAPQVQVIKKKELHLNIKVFEVQENGAWRDLAEIETDGAKEEIEVSPFKDINLSSAHFSLAIALNHLFDIMVAEDEETKAKRLEKALGYIESALARLLAYTIAEYR